MYSSKLFERSLSFTILICPQKNGAFTGSVVEVPLLGELQSTNKEDLIFRLIDEIHFLIKDRSDLREAKIDITYSK